MPFLDTRETYAATGDTRALAKKASRERLCCAMQEFAMLVESWLWQALSECISYNVLRAFALD